MKDDTFILSVVGAGCLTGILWNALIILILYALVTDFFDLGIAITDKI